VHRKPTLTRLPGCRSGPSMRLVEPLVSDTFYGGYNRVVNHSKRLDLT